MKRKIESLAPWLILSILILITFKAWFGFQEIAAGDAPFFFQENIKDLPSYPHTWVNWGVGEYSPVLSAFFYLIFPLKVLSSFNVPWLLLERVLWYWPFIFMTVFSSWYFLKTVLPKTKIGFIAPLIYLLNSYILMVIGGGQISIALGYALFPLTFSLFFKNIINGSRKIKIVSGLVFALQIAFEPRMAGIALLAVLLSAFLEYRLAISRYLKAFLLPLLIAFGTHFYWLMPLLLLRKQAYASVLSSLGWAEFLSFADFSNSFSLLHPNWPENIFGKTYFMRPEFLVIPFLAFSSLLLIANLKSRRIKKNLLFFTFLALIGAFLAKGAKPPLGEAYLWLFQYFPGMNLFRDPTKFYVLVALSYCFLIPFSLGEIIKKLKKVSGIKYLVLSTFVLYWLFLIRPAWLGQLGGTFKAKEVPQEYVLFKYFIADQESFFRTLWLPKKQRFGFFDNHHPAVSADELPAPENLATMAVKYVIIPDDSEGEIFLEDRQYRHQLRLELEQELDKVTWLKKIELFDKIAVYETSNYQDHFFVASATNLFIDLLSNSRVNELTSWQMINPTKYIVSVKINQPPATLVFSETYDESWQARLDSHSARPAKIGEKIIPSRVYNNLNSFVVDQAGDFEMIVEFTAQKYVYYGLIISGITMLFIIYSLLTS